MASITATIDGATTLATHGLTSGQSIHLLTELPVGPLTFAVTAVDNVRTRRHQHRDAHHHRHPESIKDDVTQFAAAGDIKDPGIVRSLQAKLDAAANAWHAGRCDTADNIYGAFNEPTAKAARQSPPPPHISDARYLINPRTCSS
ncbi:MAG TPA: hypothetical protein VFN75_03280 [Pseudonocardiaceae bacterium]|nr:hypothetical protein [Pseudonocardiaceae bacterium]